MTTNTILSDVEESRALPFDEAYCSDTAREMVRSMTVHNARIASLDNPALEIICAVVRRSLMYRYRNVSSEFIRDAVQEAACRFYEQGALRAEINSRTAYAWMLTVAARELGHILRNEGRFVLFSGAGDNARSSAVDTVHEAGRDEDLAASDVPSEQLSDALTYHMLLGNLSRNLAEAVQLHAEGYTADEIAAHVGCTRAAAYKRVQRGCTELRQLWREEEIRIQQLVAPVGSL
jgi:DNA-directed RNA polymerase specialized sigma24 family protein